MRAPCLILAAAIGLASCSPSEDTGDRAGSDEAAVDPAAQASAIPEDFAGSAWRVLADDGARYVTYLDEDGTYRDLRNGDPWQEGDWTFADGPGGRQLCLKPDHQDGVERCWQPVRMRDDTMIVEGPEDRRIELARVDYELPEADEGDAAE